MPLMQLSTLVLPAPLGPIRAKSSPGSTAKLTPSSTTRPPKASRRRSTSSSAIPPPAPAILLDRAVASSLAAGLAEIELLDVLVALQARGVAVKHHAAVLQHIAVVRDLEGDRGALLHQHDGDAELVADRDQAAHEVVDDDRREAERELVDQQQPRPAHERARERQHLTLAARQEAADPIAQARKLRKERKGLLLASPALGGACTERGGR